MFHMLLQENQASFQARGELRCLGAFFFFFFFELRREDCDSHMSCNKDLREPLCFCLREVSLPFELGEASGMLSPVVIVTPRVPIERHQ